MGKMSRRDRRLRRVIKIHGPTCWYCPEDAETVDHFIPRYMGGESAIGNYRPACMLCNTIKANMHPELFILLVKKFGYAWKWTKKTRSNAMRGKFDYLMYEVADKEIRVMKEQIRQEEKTKKQDELTELIRKEKAAIRNMDIEKERRFQQNEHYKKIDKQIQLRQLKMAEELLGVEGAE